jgi:hypothetical protein
MFQFFYMVILLVSWSSSPTWGIDSPLYLKEEKAISPDYILQDIKELSSPKFQGRQAGTPGGEKSAHFVAKRFKALGLSAVIQETNQPSVKKWFQSTPLTATQLLPPALVNFFPTQNQENPTSVVLQIGKDYVPVLDSPAVNLTSPVVFVGYGIHDPARGIDDYQDMDVRNRVVLFFRGKPPTYSPWITHEEKIQMAQEKGAAGFLTVTGPELNRYEARKGLGQTPLAIYSTTPENRPMPGAWLSGMVLDQHLTTIQESLESLQHQANANPGKVSRPLPIVARLSWDTRQIPGALTNVLGLLRGEDPTLRDEIILIGAHRDHFGEQAGLRFPGADDNASGTAVMLEVARRLTEGTKKPKRSILFASFDGEERGLLGSKRYVTKPARPLDRTVVMINLDHVGVGNGTLTVGVTRLDNSIAQQAATHAGLTKKIKLYGYFPGGDHVPFYEVEVPTITVVSAGVHPHFHQPSDTAEEIDPETVRMAVRFVLSVVNLLANSS